MKRTIISLVLVFVLILSNSFVVFANTYNQDKAIANLKVLETNGYSIKKQGLNYVVMESDENEQVTITFKNTVSKVYEYTFEESGLITTVKIDEVNEKVYVNGSEMISENLIHYDASSNIVPQYDPIMNWYRTVNPMIGTSSDYGAQTLVMSGNYALADTIGDLARSAFISAVSAAIKYSWSGPAGVTFVTTLAFCELAQDALGNYYDNVNGVETKVYYRQYKQAYSENSSTTQAYRHHFKFYDKDWKFVSASDPMYESWSTKF